MFQVDLKSRVPIFKQVLDYYRKQILTGRMSPDDKMPTVRELSTEIGVNPNTIQKAYRELENNGLIYSRHGKGCYVSEPTDEHVASEVARLYEALECLKSELLMHGEELKDIMRFLRDES